MTDHGSRSPALNDVDQVRGPAAIDDPSNKSTKLPPQDTSGVGGSAEQVLENGSHKENQANRTYKTTRFWWILAGLAVTSLLTAVESTVTSTALPTVSRDLSAGNLYVWFVNAFFLSRYV